MLYLVRLIKIIKFFLRCGVQFSFPLEVLSGIEHDITTSASRFEDLEDLEILYKAQETVSSQRKRQQTSPGADLPFDVSEMRLSKWRSLCKVGRSGVQDASNTNASSRNLNFQNVSQALQPSHITTSPQFLI